MMGQEDQDALLKRFLNEEDPAIAQACFETLLSEHVEPLVRDITRYKSRSSYSFGCTHEFQDEEDIRSEVVLQLISRLRDLRRSGADAHIENFRGYVAVTTYNAYYKYGTDTARSEQADQGSKEMDEKNHQMARRRMVAGRGILRNRW